MVWCLGGFFCQFAVCLVLGYWCRMIGVWFCPEVKRFDCEFCSRGMFAECGDVGGGTTRISFDRVCVSIYFFHIFSALAIILLLLLGAFVGLLWFPARAQSAKPIFWIAGW